MAFVREKIKKGIPYYYIVENYREGAKVRQRILEYIGPLDALKALALSGYRAKKDGDPITNVNCENLSFEAYEYGSVMGMYWASKIIGIENICDDVFDKVTLKDMNRGKILLMAMIQRVVCPGSKREFETWVSKTSLPYHLKFDPGDFDSQTFWEAMDSITEEQIRIAWNKIINAYMSINNINPSKMHLDYIVYHEFIDAKSGRCIICKRGHDKQKRDDLIQFTLAVLTSKEFNVPFAWHIYPGNENDKQEVGFFTSYIEEQLKELGMNPPDVTVTFDGESHSADNFKDIGFHFVCACSFKNHKELYEIDIDDYENIEIVIKYHKNIGMSKGITRLAYEVKDIECFGVHGKGVLIFSQDLKNEQMAQLNRDLDYIRSKVLEFQERIKNKKSEIYDQLKRVKEEVEEEAIIAQKYNEAIDQEERERH